jgi:hypothetical protein
MRQRFDPLLIPLIVVTLVVSIALGYLTSIEKRAIIQQVRDENKSIREQIGLIELELQAAKFCKDFEAEEIRKGNSEANALKKKCMRVLLVKKKRVII